MTLPNFAFWKWVAIGVLTTALVVALWAADSRGAKLDAMTKERDAAVANAQAWAKAHAEEKRLAEETAAARAEETRQLIDLARQAGKAKQGIANAPGATDRYRYSDAAYSFMRGQAPPEDGTASTPDPGLE